MKVDIYTKNGCHFCSMAKNEFTNKKIPYNELVLGANSTKEEIILRLKSMGINSEPRTVPQIFIDDKYVGGYEDLKRFLQSL